MDRVRKDIFDAIEDRDDLDQKTVAKALGITERYLTKFKSGGNINFRKLMRLAFILWPEQAHKKISAWCSHLDSVELIKNAFEYAAITRNTSLLESLIETHKDCDRKIKECTDVYSFILNYMRNGFQKTNIKAEIKKIKNIKDESLLILLDIYRCIDSYLKRKFTILPDLAECIEEKINDLSDDRNLFIKECFVHRLSEILSHTHLHLNNLAKARHYSWIIINAAISPKTVSDAYAVLSQSYIHENTEKSFSYINESFRFMQETEVPYLIDFAKYNVNYIYLLIDKDVEDDADPALKAVQDVKRGVLNPEDVKEVVEGSDDEDLILYFQTITCDTNEGLNEKFHYFLSNANMYSAAAVVAEMVRRGENSNFVNSLKKISLNPNQNLGDDYFEETFISSFNSGTVGVRSLCA